MMKYLGVHVLTGAGHEKAVAYAQRLHCKAMQFFSGNPRSYNTGPVDVERFARFAQLREQAGIARAVIHTPYLINLASEKQTTRAHSIRLIRHDLAVAAAGRIHYVNTHLGSYGERERAAGFSQVVTALETVLDGIDPGVDLVLENSAGAGNLCGGTIEELGAFLKAVDHPQLHVCIDTAHAWSAGYDINSKDGVERLVELLAREVSLNRVKMFHFNDTQIPLGGHRDRHWHIGEGLIGLEGFRALLHLPEFDECTAILETPGEEEDDIRNMQTIHKLMHETSNA